MATEIISNKGTNGEPLTDKNGNPIEDARIIAYHTGGEYASDGDIFTTTTDSAGEYAFTSDDLPATYLSNETAKKNYLHIFAEIGSGSTSRQAVPIRPWQPYELETALPDGTVTIYNFENNGDTTTVTDGLGNYKGDIFGNATYNTDAYCASYSLAYNGTDEYTVSQADASLNTNGVSDELSLAAWIKPDTIHNGYVIGYQPLGDNDNHLYIQLRDSGVVRGFLQVNGSNYITSGGSYSTGVWQHVAITCSNLELKLYLDGSEIASSTSVANPNNIGTGRLITAIRESSSGSPYDGLIDDAAYGNRVWSQADIQLLIDRCGGL